MIDLLQRSHTLSERSESRPRRFERGQSLVELGLVVPILLILVVAIADFGRIFATGVIIEAAARNAAELAANEYLSRPPGSDATPPVPLSAPAPTGVAAYYTSLHDQAARNVCAETQELPNSNFDPGTGKCIGMPFVMVCIHDSQDTSCSSETLGATPPAECSEFIPAPTNAHAGSGSPRWAEVRVCYRFTSILDLPLVSFGTFWLQRTRSFVIPCYFVLGSQECG